MNWKFWTWARQIRELKAEKDQLTREVIIKRKEPEPPNLTMCLTDPAWPGKLAQLKERLKATPENDPTLVGLLGLCDSFVVSELGPLTQCGLDDAELHRLRGRVGMFLDFKAEILKLWRDGRQEAAREQTSKS